MSEVIDLDCLAYNYRYLDLRYIFLLFRKLRKDVCKKQLLYVSKLNK